MTLCAGNAAVNQRQFDIVQRRRARQQIKSLKDEANFLITNAGQLVIVHLGNVFAVQPVFALRWRIETADQIHER